MDLTFCPARLRLLFLVGFFFLAFFLGRGISLVYLAAHAVGDALLDASLDLGGRHDRDGGPVANQAVPHALGHHVAGNVRAVHGKYEQAA